MEDEWLSLPTIARELNLAESTARRWAATWSEVFPARGHGAARRFHGSTRQRFLRVQQWFETGYTTKQIGAMLLQEFPATVDVVREPDVTETSSEATLLALTQRLETVLHDIEARLTAQMAAAQTEVAQMKTATAQNDALLQDMTQQNMVLKEQMGQLTQELANFRSVMIFEMTAEVRNTMAQFLAKSTHHRSHRRWWWPWKP